MDFGRLWSTSGPIATLFILVAWFLVLRLGLTVHRITRRWGVVDVCLWTYLYAGVGLVAQKVRIDLLGLQDFALLLIFPVVSILIWTLSPLLLTLLWPLRWLTPPIPPETPEHLQRQLLLSLAVAVVLASLTTHVLRRWEARLTVRQMPTSQR